MKNSRKTIWNVLYHSVANLFILATIVLMVFSVISKQYLYLIPLSLGLLSGLIVFFHDFRNYIVFKYQNKKIHIIKNNAEVESYSSRLKIGDIYKAYPNDIITFSGKVINGIVLVDESKINGQSNPVTKKYGDSLRAGSIILDGSAEIEVIDVSKISYLKRSKVNQTPVYKLMSNINSVLGFACLIVFLSMYIIGSINKNINLKEMVGVSLLTIPSVFNFIVTIYCLIISIEVNKKGISVNELTGLTNLHDFDVLCLDKTGTITDGHFSVYKVVPWIHITSSLETPNVVMSQIVADVLRANNEKGLLFDGLNKHFNYELSKVVEESSPYSKNGMYSACTFKGNKTYAIGEVNSFDLINKESIMNVVNEYSYGYKVLLLVESKNPLKLGLIEGKCQAIGAIVLEERIRKELNEFFENAYKNNTSIKVISGDTALTTSEIARQAGIDNSTKAINIDEMSFEALALIIDEYVVFGKASVTQKEFIVNYLQEQGHKVAFVGDGDNDTQALKTADVSIAFENASLSAKHCAQVVVSELSLDLFDIATAQGQKMKSNIMRSSVLFYAQCIFGVFASLLFLFNKNVPNPFTFDRLLWFVALGIYIPGIFMLFDKSDSRQSSFHSIRHIIFASLLFIIPIGILYLLQWMQFKGYGYFGLFPDRDAGNNILPTSQVTNSISYIVLPLLSLAILYKMLNMKNTIHVIVFSSLAFIQVLFVLFIVFDADFINKITYIDTKGLTWPPLYCGCVVTLLSVSIYLFILTVIEIIKGEQNA